MPDNVKELDALIKLRRRALAAEARRVYAETRSLRRTAARLNVSHTTVANLLRELEREVPHGPAA